VLEYIAGITVTVPALQGIITVFEILLIGFLLYWIWEMVLKLSGRIGKGTAKTATVNPGTTPSQIPETGAENKSIGGAESKNES